jgi:hypothetical protein
LKIWEILRIVQGDRPPETSRNRKVYDAAIAKLGEEGGRDGALTYLQRALIGSLQRLQELKPEGPEDLGDNAAPLRNMLEQVNKGAAADKEGFDVIAPHLSLITALLGVTEGVPTDAQSGPRETDTAARAQPLPIIEMPVHDLGPIHLLSRSDTESVVAVNADAGPTTIALFGSQEQAQTAVNAIAGGYATLANHPNDAARQREAATALFNALSAIPNEREIWSSASFQDAMRRLEAGDLEGGLQALSTETSLNSVFQSLNNMYVVSVNQRAVAIFRAGVTVRYEFDQNMQAFQEYMRGSRKKGFEPRFIWLALGMYYEYLAMSGQLQQLQVNAQTGELNTIGTQKLQGSGHVISLKPEVAIGTGVGGESWAQPIEIVLHSTIIPYEKWSIEGNVAMEDGSTQRLEIGDEGAMIGLTGIEVRFPGQEGERGIVRLSRVGAGVVPTVQQQGGETSVLANPLAYLTVEGNWLEGNKVRLQTLVTPQYAYFLRQHQAGGDIQPLNTAIYAGEEGKHRFNFGLGFRYEYSMGNQVHTMEGYGTFGYAYRRTMEIGLRGGYITEAGGDEMSHIPDSPFGSLNLQLNIGELFRPSGGSTKDAVPRKTKKK